jgi:hypothetical protein
MGLVVPGGRYARGRLGAHALRGGVRLGEVGVVSLDGLELAKEAVVLGVTDLGIVEDVIAVVVMLDRLAQLRRPFSQAVEVGAASGHGDLLRGLTGARPSPILPAFPRDGR